MDDKKGEIKTYLKIKSIKSQEDSSSTISISSNRNMLTVFSKPTNINSTKTKTEYEIDKIFIDTDQYSSICQEIAQNCISEAPLGKNYCYISYGETNGEKHPIIFGGSNSHINITERGLFPHLLNSFLLKPNISISYSIMCINNNKLVDLSKYCNSKEIIPSLSQEDLLSEGIEIKQSPEVSNQINKITINDYKDFIPSLESYNVLFSHLYQTESNTDYDLFSLSDFIYVIYISDKTTPYPNTNNLISTITLLELAGNEMKNSQASLPKFTIRNSIKNTRGLINNTHTLESLKKTIRSFRNVKSDNKLRRISNFQVENDKLLLVLQQLCFCIPLTSYIAIGSINLSIQNSINETLQFLFDIRKIGIEKEKGNSSTVSNNDEANKDNSIYKLKLKCKEQQVEINDLNNRLKFEKEKLERHHQLYQSQIEKLKSTFAFEGDVNILIGGNEYSKEARNARKISNAIANLAHEKKKNEDLEKEITNLKKKISTLISENELLRNDQSMITYIRSHKEQNKNDQDRLRIHLDNSLMMNKLKEEKEKLLLMNKEYQKEVEVKYNIIQGFGNLIKNKLSNGIDKEEMRADIQKELDERYKEEYRLLQMRYNKELDVFAKKYEAKDKLRDEKIAKKTISHEESIGHQKIIERYTKEMIFLYELILLLISNYKQEFGWRYTENISPVHYNHFINSREKYMKHVDSIETYINLINFPITIKEYNTKIGSLIRKRLHDDLNNQSLKLKLSFEVKTKEGENDDDNNKHQQRLAKENQTLKDKIRELNESTKAKDYDKEKDRLMILNNQLTKNIEELINENQRNKILISANERIVNRLNAEIVMIKAEVNKKKTTNSLNYPCQLISIRTRNSQPKHLNKAKSGDDIIAPNLFIRPKTSSIQH